MTTEQLTDRELDAWIAEHVMGWSHVKLRPDWDYGWWGNPPPVPGCTEIYAAELPYYSIDWGAAGMIMDYFADQRRYLWLSYEAKSYLTGNNHMVWRASFAAPQEFHVTTDSAPRAIALAAKRYTEIMAAANP